MEMGRIQPDVVSLSVGQLDKIFGNRWDAIGFLLAQWRLCCKKKRFWHIRDSEAIQALLSIKRLCFDISIGTCMMLSMICSSRAGRKVASVIID